MSNTPPANYRPLSEVIAEWRAHPQKAALMDRYRDDARAYFRDHPIVAEPQSGTTTTTERTEP